MRDSQIGTYYTPSQVCTAAGTSTISRSPQKPALLMEEIKGQGLAECFNLHATFVPFNRDDFKIAHTPEYVEAVFEGREPLCSSNGLNWSRELVESVCFTNASLYNAIRSSITEPEQVAFSPTSGFHHAQPGRGKGFCTFSGQVIAAVKIYQELGLSGAFIDLDGHFGNSIEDSRASVPELNLAIPPGCNINPSGMHENYVEDFRQALSKLADLIRDGKIHYVVFCHGADSHIDDDLGGQCTTSEWLECSKTFYQWVRQLDQERNTPLPTTLSLFGGYRHFAFNSVLSLHLADLVVCLNTLCGRNIEYQPAVETRDDR